MRIDVERRIVKLRNELRSLKQTQELAYAQLLKPERAPQISYNGAITGAPTTDLAMRTRVRFTRNDNINEPPFVDFALDFRFSPNYVEFWAQYGEVYTGDDLDAFDEDYFKGYIAEVGSNYVDYFIDVPSEIVMAYSPFISLNFSMTVQAISLVSGSLTVERIV